MNSDLLIKAKRIRGVQTRQNYVVSYIKIKTAREPEKMFRIKKQKRLITNKNSKVAPERTQKVFWKLMYDPEVQILGEDFKLMIWLKLIRNLI